MGPDKETFAAADWYSDGPGRRGTTLSPNTANDATL